MAYMSRRVSGSPDQLAERLISILRNYKPLGPNHQSDDSTINRLFYSEINLRYKNDLPIMLALQKLKGDMLGHVIYAETVNCNTPVGGHDNMLVAYMTVMEEDPDLHQFMFQSDINNIEDLVRECKGNVNAYNKDKKTSLVLAMERPEMRVDYIRVIKYFLDHGANVNQLNRGGQTALMVASQLNLVSVARMLLDYGARVDIKDYYGKSAIDYARTREMKFTLLKPMTSPGIRSPTKPPEVIKTLNYSPYIKAHGEYIRNYKIGMDRRVTNGLNIDMRVNTAEKLICLYTIGEGSKLFGEGILHNKLVEMINRAPRFGPIVVYSGSKYFSSSRLPRPGDTFRYPRIMSTTWNYNEVLAGLAVFVDQYKEKAGHCCILILNIKPPYLFIPDQLAMHPEAEESEILITPRSFVVRKIGRTSIGEGPYAQVLVTIYLDETSDPYRRDFFDPLVVQIPRIGADCRNQHSSSTTELKSLLLDSIDYINFEKVKRVFNYSGNLRDFSEYISKMDKKTFCNLMARYYNET